MDGKVISGKIAKTVFDEMVSSGKEPKAIVEEKGLVQITDGGAITEIVEKVIAENPKEVEAYKAGKKKLLGFFVGQVMKATRGKANPRMVNDILKGVLPVGTAHWIFGVGGWEIVLIGIMPSLGHAFSPFLGFNGGKALATSLVGSLSNGKSAFCSAANPALSSTGSTLAMK